MQLSLNQLIPIPLRDKLKLRPSAIWQQDIVWQQGAYIFIQAPSGTGKTTLIHYIFGIREDYEGAVKWDDHTLSSVADKSKLRTQDLSVIFQDMRLFPELTAWENLELKRGLTDTVPQAAMQGMMVELGIEDKRDALVKTMSYGEQQRLAIIRSLLQPFKWLLMDEPFSHLDEANTATAAALILRIVKQNDASILMADLDSNNYFPYTKKLTL